MMPKTSVNPAASKNSKRPNCSPFRNCSTTSSMFLRDDPHFAGLADNSPTLRGGFKKIRQRFSAAASLKQNSCSFHRTLVVIAILIVLDDGGDGLERQGAVGVLHHVLQIEILNRDVVVAVSEGAAHRLEIGLFHRRLHRVLLAQIAVDRDHPAVDQRNGVVSLRTLERRAQARVLFLVGGAT